MSPQACARDTSLVATADIVREHGASNLTVDARSAKAGIKNDRPRSCPLIIEALWLVVCVLQALWVWWQSRRPSDG